MIDDPNQQRAEWVRRLQDAAERFDGGESAAVTRWMTSCTREERTYWLGVFRQLDRRQTIVVGPQMPPDLSPEATSALTLACREWERQSSADQPHP